MKKIFYSILWLFRWLGKFFRTTVTVLSSLFFLAFLIGVPVLLFNSPKVMVPEGTALILAPVGDIVEKRSPIDPMAGAINNLAGIPVPQETFLQDIIDAVNTATEDHRIKLIVLAPDRMKKAGLNQIQAIGQAIDTFKNAGKKVVATGNTFNQMQYYLASWADEIYLHPMGGVALRGFGVFRLYVQTLLNNLDIDIHVFRVGTFKSALEPIIRNDMSLAAKEANKLWLDNLWATYCNDIATHRDFSPATINETINNLAIKLRRAQGDKAEMALEAGLIDGLQYRHEFEQYMTKLVGPAGTGDSFNHISLQDYLQTFTRSYTSNGEQDELVGIISANGNIVYGEGTVSQIGSAPLIRQIRQARKDKRIKALVLRITSGGGSAFASELIRQELLRMQKAGKPVVVSMGSVAASGGYWLAANADKILASPTTLTGSIGIFGAIPTFDKALAKLGVFSDGVGTTTMAHFGNPTSQMSEQEKAVFQMGVVQGYSRFLNIVANGRKLDLSTVENIAEGRVWDGSTALRLGLIDKFGTLEDAVTAAADLAGVPRGNGVYIHIDRSGLRHIFRQMTTSTLALTQKTFAGSMLPAPLHDKVSEEFGFLLDSPDPGHIYAHSLLPPSPIAF